MMQTILGRLLGAFGLLTLALYLALSLFGTVPWAHWVGATGALAFTSWIYLDWDSLSRFFGSQGGREQTISWTLVVVVAGIAGLALHFAQRKPVQWDFSEGQVHTLDPQFEEILRKVPTDLEIRIFGFFAYGADPVEETRLQRFLDLRDSARSINPKISFEHVNPNLDPIRAERYGITRSGIVVVQARPRPLPGQPEPTPAELRKETLNEFDYQELANALLRIQQEDQQVVYFVTDHGERTPQTPSEAGTSVLGRVLTSLGFVVRSWASAGAASVPDDADILVLAGPKTPMQPAEVETVRRWVEAGGSLLAMVEPKLGGAAPETATDPLEEALRAWGLLLRPDLVLDEVRGLHPIVPLAGPAGNHSIVGAMASDIPVVFETVRSIELLEGDAGTVRLHPLLQSSEFAWGETDFTSQEPSPDPDQDSAGPLVLAALAELPDSSGSVLGRVVVTGDVDWATDAGIGAFANGDFATRVFGYLGAQEDLVQLPPKDRSISRMDLEPVSLLLLILTAVLLAPGASALVGVVLWGWRRNL